jgi:hypothetical protein
MPVASKNMKYRRIIVRKPLFCRYANLFWYAFEKKFKSPGIEKGKDSILT